MNVSVLATSREAQVLASSRPVRAIGIDLGTTNSAIAEVFAAPEMSGPPKARCIDVDQWTRQGPLIHTLVPSVLAIHHGQVRVGAGAKDLRARLADHKLQRNRNIFWDCKNDIGVRRTYNKAPVGFQSAKEISGHVLKFLISAASDGPDSQADEIVVTVPASFQAAQRQDTIDAARLAGIELTAGALMDEPVAAFVDYTMTHGADAFSATSDVQRLVVFDFGGGTCDIAIFELRPPTARAPDGIGVAPLAVSRYHRLGGGDIDRKIVVDVLIPQLRDENGSQPHDLDFREKSEYVIPALLGCAEALKIGLCREIERLTKLNIYEEKYSTLRQKHPGVYNCNLPTDKQLILRAATLSAIELDKVLEPFLDRDLLHARETDYLMMCSIFAPIQDALAQAKLDPGQIGYCLLVGGSSLIPQVVESVRSFFDEAKILSFDNREDMQNAVAHGAAWQALSIAVRGNVLIHPITGSSICIRTKGGPVELIPDGVALPYPEGEEWGESDRLVVPKTDLFEDLKLRVELCDANDRLLMNKVWTPPQGVREGDQLRTMYRIDENQVLHFRLGIAGSEDKAEQLELVVENPLSNVVNPNAKRDDILKLEESIRAGTLTRQGKLDAIKSVAELESDLGHFERSLYLLGGLNRTNPDVETLNRMGIIAGRMSDHDREEKFYREAARMQGSWNGPLFNLALSKQRQGKLNDAMQTIDEAISCEADPPALILKAELLEKLDRPKKQRNALLKRAFNAFGSVSTLSEFELTWYRIGARLANDSARVASADQERKRRDRSSNGGDCEEGELPTQKNEMVRVQS